MSKIRILFGMFLFVFVFSFFSVNSLAASDVVYSDSVSCQFVDRQLCVDRQSNKIISIPALENLTPGNFYEVKISGVLSLNGEDIAGSDRFWYNQVTSLIDFNGTLIGLIRSTSATTSPVRSTSFSRSFVYEASLNPVFSYYQFLTISTNNESATSFDYDYTLSLSVDSVIEISTSDASDYQSGYDAGFSDGYNQGQYSGFSDGYAAGQESGYNSGFSAGVDSVDTQSYYDSGYVAGEVAGFADGYNSGYQDGFNDAMARYEGWGADNTDYPVQIYEYIQPDGHLKMDTLNDGYGIFMEVNDNNFYKYVFSADFIGTGFLFSDITDLDPNHVYKIVLNDYHAYDMYSEFDFILDIGSKSFRFAESHSHEDLRNIFVFANGYDLGSSLSFRMEGKSRFDYEYLQAFHVYFSSIHIFDYGPIGNTQNQIANQTDDLTNGYDSSAGDAASITFSDNAASLEAAESSIFTSAKSSLDGYSFFDIESVPAVVTGLSFVSATMTSIFGAMGGASGAGIVLSVLFSVMIVSIVIGLYRYFVSSGKSGSSKGGKK